MEERARKCSSVLLHFIHQFLIGTEMENVIGLNIYSHKSTVSCYRFKRTHTGCGFYCHFYSFYICISIFSSFLFPYSSNLQLYL